MDAIVEYCNVIKEWARTKRQKGRLLGYDLAKECNCKLYCMRLIANKVGNYEIEESFLRMKEDHTH